MPKSVLAATQDLNKRYKNLNYTPPAAWWLALLSALATRLGPGVEVSLAGYARKQITWGTVTSDGELTNTNTMIVSVTSGSVSVLGFRVMSAATAGNYFHFGRLESPWLLTPSKPLIVKPGELHLVE